MNYVRNNFDLSEVEKIIDYEFSDKSLLSRAFTHSSYANENKTAYDYERLEFLGDAVLDYVVGLYLFERFPTEKEGILTKKRANLVSADTLSNIIDELQLAKYMRVGAGNCDEIMGSQNVKCDLFEAIVGAILLDSGKDLSVAKNFVLKCILPYVDINIVDYTTVTNEYCAKNNISLIYNEVQTDAGKQPYFKFELLVNGECVAIGEGKNKQTAKKNACKIYYNEHIKQDG